MHRFLSYSLATLALSTLAGCVTPQQPDLEVAALGEQSPDAIASADGITLEAGTDLSVQVVSHASPNATPASLADEGDGGIEIVAVDGAPAGRFLVRANEPGTYWAIAIDEASEVELAIPVVVLPRADDESIEPVEIPDLDLGRSPPANGATPAKYDW